MFCRNCGEEYVVEQAVICVKCGVNKGNGHNYCPVCGKPTNGDAKVCLNCGVALLDYSEKSDKSKLAAGLLGIFLGIIGAHNFYLGYKKKAIIQLLITLLSLGMLAFIPIVWGFIEGVLILCDKTPRDAEGLLLN